MTLNLTSTENFAARVNLSNSNDVVANSLSIIEETRIVNLRELIGEASKPLNWLSGDSTGKNTISTGQGLLSLATPGNNDTFDNAVVIWGSAYTTKVGEVSFFKKVSMNQNLDVSGAMTVGGLPALTTGTGYAQTETYSETQVNNMFNQAPAYTNSQLGVNSNAKAQTETLLNTKEPAFITVSPHLKNLNFENGTIDLMLSSDFTDSVNTKTDETQVRALLAAHDPVSVQSPVEKIRHNETGTYT